MKSACHSYCARRSEGNPEECLSQLLCKKERGKTLKCACHSYCARSEGNPEECLS